MRSNACLLIVLLLFANVALVHSITLSGVNNNLNTQKSLVAFTYIPHDAISINNNEDFNTTYNFEGNGTLDEPFVIEGINTTSITIYNTDAYFIIKGCYIQEKIHLENVATATATVFNNTIVRTDSNNDGIILLNSPSSNISFNSLSSANLYIDVSVDTFIGNNSFINGGLRFIGASYFNHQPLLEHLQSYIVTGNTVNGKLLGYYIDENDLVFTESLFGQIFLINCSHGMIVNLEFSDTVKAIYSKSSINITISENTFNNTHFGIRLDNVQNSSVIFNTFRYSSSNEISFYQTHSVIVENNSASKGYGEFNILQAYNLTISTNIISDGNVFSGIRMTNSELVLIKDNVLSMRINLFRTSWVDTNSFCTIINNTANEIRSIGNVNLTISGNTINERFLSQNSYNVTLSDNIFGLGLQIEEDTVEAYESYTLTNNSVGGGTVGWYINQHGLVLDSIDHKQIYIINSNFSTLGYSTFSNSFIPLYVRHSYNFTIEYNTFINNTYYSMKIWDSVNTTVTDNTLMDTKPFGTQTNFAMNFRNCISTIVRNNYIDESHGAASNLKSINFDLSQYGIIENNTLHRANGIYLYSDTHSFDIVGNRIEHGSVGIRLFVASHINILNNTVLHTYGFRIHVDMVDNCTVAFNYVYVPEDYNHPYGIILSRTYDSVVYYNSIFSYFSTSQSLGQDEHGGVNTWYNETLQKGNYWGNYEGIGTYAIDGNANAEDLYPLAECPFDTLAPLITDVSFTPIEPKADEEVIVTAKITDNYWVNETIVYFCVNQSEIETVSMTRDGVFFTASLGSFSVMDEVVFYIVARDLSSNEMQTGEYSFYIPDVEPPTITNYKNYTASPPYEDQSLHFDAKVTDDGQVTNVSLVYRIDNGEWIFIEMPLKEYSEDYYEYILSPLDADTIFDYYYLAYDLTGKYSQTDIMTFTVQSLDDPTPPPDDDDNDTDDPDDDDSDDGVKIPFSLFSFLAIPIIAGFLVRRRNNYKK